MSEVTEGFLLSPQQQRMVRLGAAQLDVHAIVRVSGPFDVGAFERALNRTMHGYEVFNTSFHCAGALQLPLQTICATSVLRIDTTSVPLAITFDLAQPPLIRVWWQADADRGGTLTFIASALIADLPTLRNFVGDAVAEYLRLDRAVAEPSWSFVDVAQWYRDLIESPQTAAARHYWRLFDPNTAARQVLASERAVTSMEYQPGLFQSAVPTTLEARIREVSALLGVDERTIYLLAFVEHLRRLLDAQEITVAVRCCGRTQDELQSVRGPLDRLVPLRWLAPQALCLGDALRELKNIWSELQEWQAYFALPFATEEARLQRMPFGFDHCELAQLPGDSQQAFELVALHGCTEPHTLQLTVCSGGEAAALCWRFDRQRLELDYVRLLDEQYLATLQALLVSLEGPLAATTSIGPIERQRLEHVSVASSVPPMLVHQRFEQATNRAPDDPALCLGDEVVTYGALNARVDELADGLRALGVGPDVPVGLAISPGIEAIVGLFAVLKAGGAFVPLDARAPRPRLAKMIDAARLQWVLASEDSRDAFAGMAVMCLVPHEMRNARRPQIQAAVRPFTDNLAYVMFTSGSTGVPKGVAISHANVDRYVSALHARLGLPAKATMATPASLYADFAYTVIFGALCTGRAIRLVPPEAVHGADTLLQALADSSFLKIVPSHFAAVAEGGGFPLPPSNGVLMFGGEALPRTLLERLRREAPGCRVINHYGPTETTIGVCVLDTNAGELRQTHTVPIGTPLSHADVLILDAELRLTSLGVPGDLYVRGQSLARGYLHRPDLTAQAFIPDPLSTEPGARMYRSGDRGRRLCDGSIEFLGRADRQVKVRGYRVELGEIERELSAQPNITQALVRAVTDTRGHISLVAYFTAAGTHWTAATLHAALRARLPAYMLPVAYVCLEAFPRLSNGKLDLVNLPPPTARDSPRATTASAPNTQAERIVQEIWRELLDIEDIGVTDNFFDAGGHSLLLIKLRGRLMQRFGREISLVELFKHTTVRAQAGYMEAAPDEGALRHASSRAAERALARERRRKRRVEEHG